MNRKPLVAALAIVVLLAGGAYAWHASHTQEQTLSLSGNVDIREVNLAFRVGGRLKTLKVDEGAQVKAGDLLGEIDSDPYRIALNDATAADAALQAHKALYHEGYRKEDIEQAQQTLEARRAAQRNAEQVYQRQLKLADTGASTERALDDARSQRDQAVALTAAAKDQFHALSVGYRKNEIEEVNANAARASAQLEQARLQLADTRLLAPTDGTILTRAVEPGSMLGVGSTVMTLSLDRPVWVRTYVSETDLGTMAPGKKVQVYIDARKQPYDAVVGFVSPTAEFTPKNVETQDLRTALMYRLRVIVQNPDSALRQGMPVTVKVARGN
jgi:HlyD family secretion protein